MLQRLLTHLNRLCFSLFLLELGQLRHNDLLLLVQFVFLLLDEVSGGLEVELARMQLCLPLVETRLSLLYFSAVLLAELTVLESRGEHLLDFAAHLQFVLGQLLLETVNVSEPALHAFRVPRLVLFNQLL